MSARVRMRADSGVRIESATFATDRRGVPKLPRDNPIQKTNQITSIAARTRYAGIVEGRRLLCSRAEGVGHRPVVSLCGQRSCDLRFDLRGGGSLRAAQCATDQLVAVRDQIAQPGLQVERTKNQTNIVHKIMK